MIKALWECSESGRDGRHREESSNGSDRHVDMGLNQITHRQATMLVRPVAMHGSAE